MRVVGPVVHTLDASANLESGAMSTPRPAPAARRPSAVLRPLLLLLAVVAAAVAAAPAGARAAGLPPVRHVWVIVLENESAATTFAAGSPAPYLAHTLPAEGAFVPNYYGTGHESNDNYISMISGQAPNPQNQADCQYFTNLEPGTLGPNGQAIGSGCVFPADVATIASQLQGAHLTWRDYNEDMGNDPARESATCGHPAIGARDGTQTATAGDQYAARHDPFVYFHAIIDDASLCDSHVVSLNDLPGDLAQPGQTPNYSFITPNLCNDGHDSPCANGQPGGLVSANAFLQTWIPRITASAAYRRDGLIIVTFDEASSSDASSCCGEIPGPNSPAPGIGGSGGGRVGAVLLSPFIAPGTVTQTAYNHYTMLGSIESLFGLAHLGEAALPGETYFGSDIFTAPAGPSASGGSAGSSGSAPRSLRLQVPALASTAGAGPRLTLRFSGAGRGVAYTVQARDVTRSGAWRTLIAHRTVTSVGYRARPGDTYLFRVSAPGSTPAVRQTVVPSGVGMDGARFTAGWRILHRRGAWRQQAVQTTRPGAGFALRFRGGSLTLIGDRTRAGGTLEVIVDGHARTVRLDAARLNRRRVVMRIALREGRHRVTVRDVRGLVALEGVAIADRRVG
jgi:hypothetical protein